MLFGYMQARVEDVQASGGANHARSTKSTKSGKRSLTSLHIDASQRRARPTSLVNTTHTQPQHHLPPISCSSTVTNDDSVERS